MATANPYLYIVPGTVYHEQNIFLQAGSAIGRVFTSNSYYVLRAVWAVFSVASISGSLRVQHVINGVAPGLGTDQLTVPIFLSGVTDTIIGGALIATPTVITPTDGLALFPQGDFTGLQGCCVTLYLEQRRCWNNLDF